MPTANYRLTSAYLNAATAAAEAAAVSNGGGGRGLRRLNASLPITLPY
jgi:hypothetical protein